MKVHLLFAAAVTTLFLAPASLYAEAKDDVTVKCQCAAIEGGEQGLTWYLVNSNKERSVVASLEITRTAKPDEVTHKEAKAEKSSSARIVALWKDCPCPGSYTVKITSARYSD